MQFSSSNIRPNKSQILVSNSDWREYCKGTQKNLSHLTIITTRLASSHAGFHEVSFAVSHAGIYEVIHAGIHEVICAGIHAVGHAA